MEKNIQREAERKRNQRIIWFLIAAVVIGLSVILWPRRSNDLVYNGKTVAAWFDEISEKRDSLFSPRTPSARDAFEYFGARAQPFLLRWAQKEPPALAKLRDRWLDQLPKWMQKWPRKIHPQQWYVERRRLALVMLGFVEEWERTRPGGNMPRTGQFATNALPALVHALNDGDETIRLVAAVALRNLGEKAWPAIPNLTESLTDADLKVAIGAMQAIGRIGPRATNAIAKVAAIARDPTDPLRAEAVKTLGEIGPAAGLASPILSSLLMENTVEPQTAIIAGGASKGVDENRVDVQVRIVSMLGTLPSKEYSSATPPPPRGQQVSESVLPSHRVEPLALEAPRSGVVTYSVPFTPRTISASPGTRSAKTSQMLSRAIRTNTSVVVPNDRRFKALVANALLRIGGIPDEAAPAVERLLASEGTDRIALAVALWRRNPNDRNIQRHVIASLKSDDWLQRMSAARLLGEAGTNAAVFLPELRRLLEDSQLFVRRGATSAVERINPKTP